MLKAVLKSCLRLVLRPVGACPGVLRSGEATDFKTEQSDRLQDGAKRQTS
jgi:hypothetical protein